MGNACESSKSITYKDSGVDIDVADATKREMKETLENKSSRVLNSLGAFASLYDIKFDDISHPIMVIKMEEPGSKQMLAAKYNRLPEVAYDLVNHLINDTICVGAKPLAIQDTIVCGSLDKDTVLKLVENMVTASRGQDCDLVGGETSEQPGVLDKGTYILSAACVGIVDKSKIIDGSKIKAGQVVLSLASNGVHTNGYTLVRKILENNPNLDQEKVGDETFIDAVLKPHVCYNLGLQKLFTKEAISGLAHITGGGVVDNLKRVLPKTVNAKIDLAKINVLDVFKVIAKAGNVPEEDMLRTYNLGVGMAVVCDKENQELITDTFKEYGVEVYKIGDIETATEEAKGEVLVENKICL